MSFFENVVPTLFLLVIGVIIMAAIYFSARWNVLLGAFVFCVGVCVFQSLTQVGFHDSDPAGNAMSAGFATLFDWALAIVMAIVFYLFMKFNSNPDKVLNVSMVLLGIYFVKRLVWFFLYGD